jgi:hypothetical protein
VQSFLVQPQPPRFQPGPTDSQGLPQSLPVTAHQHEVVAVANIPAYSGLIGQQMVEPVEIPIGEPLARQVADGQTLPSPHHIQERIAWKPVLDLLLFVGPVHDQVHQPQCCRILHDAPELRFEYLVVDAGEKLPDVGGNRQRKTTHERLQTIGSRVGPFALSTGIAVRRKAPFQDRFQHVHQCMMNDAIAVRRGADQAALGPCDPMRTKGTWAIGAVLEFALDPQQLTFKVVFEGLDCRFVPLAAARPAGRQQEVGP